MDQLLVQLVATELYAAEHATKLEELIAVIRRDRVPILRIVTPLGPNLTNDVDAIRTRACTLLAEVWGHAGQLLGRPKVGFSKSALRLGFLSNWHIPVAPCRSSLLCLRPSRLLATCSTSATSS